MRVDLFLKKNNIEPDVMLDQCFMKDEDIINKIIETAELEKDDVVMEIGSGTGVLTRRMVYKVKKIVCIEKDPRLVRILKKLFSNKKNVKIIEDDITSYGLKNYKKIISNLPYTIIDWFFKELINKDFDKAVVTISKKSYDKIGKDVLLNAYLKIEKVCIVPKNSFWPEQKNHSVLLSIVPKKELTNNDKKIREFYETNNKKKLKEFKKKINHREGNKKIKDLSGKEISHLLNRINS